jgi:hypothetical protein
LFPAFTCKWQWLRSPCAFGEVRSKGLRHNGGSSIYPLFNQKNNPPSAFRCANMLAMAPLAARLLEKTTPTGLKHGSGFAHCFELDQKG